MNIYLSVCLSDYISAGQLSDKWQCKFCYVAALC